MACLILGLLLAWARSGLAASIGWNTDSTDYTLTDTVTVHPTRSAHFNLTGTVLEAVSSAIFDLTNTTKIDNSTLTSAFGLRDDNSQIMRALLLSNLRTAGSNASLAYEELNMGSPFLANKVANSSALISPELYHSAYLAAQPFLETPLNGTDHTYFNPFSYMDFMNTAVLVGNITSVSELAMYYAQILYQSNGFKWAVDPVCIDTTSAACKALNLTATVDGVTNNFYGRGYLRLTGLSSYVVANEYLFGRNSTVFLKHPDLAVADLKINFAVSAWKWKHFVQDSKNGALTSFGGTTLALRPNDCNSNVLAPLPQSQRAYNVYVAVLKTLSATSIPTSGLC